MTVDHVEFLVEEPSMEAALRSLLPRLLGGISFEIYNHRSKDELLRRLPSRLSGYAKRRSNDAWFRDRCRIVVVVDRDGDDCIALKRKIDTLARRAGLALKADSRSENWAVLVRIAVEELEAWYFGDWQAVRAAYAGLSPHVPRQAAYRDPDAIAGGTWEAFERIMQRAGHFAGGLRKIEAARNVAERMDPDVNTSRSFQVFRDAVRQLAAA